MLDSIWNLIKIVCGPFTFVANMLAKCWRGMWWITKKVISIISFLAPPAIAVWMGTAWKGTRAVVSPGRDETANVDVETVFVDSQGHMKTHAEQLTMSIDEFEHRDFSGLSGELQQFDDAISQILNEGNSVSFRFGN